jgi:hypothetical protein
VIRGERHDVFRIRQSSLDQHLPRLDDQWASGCRNGAELWPRLLARGFRGSFASLVSGRPVDDGLKRPTRKIFSGSRRLGPSRAS